MLDTLSSQNLGLIMPGATIDSVAVQFTEGSGIWRIISSQTLKIKRWGYCNDLANVDNAECKIPVYALAPDDLLEVYTQDLNATSNKSNVLAWVQTSKGFDAFGLTAITDSTATEILSLLNSQSIGAQFFDSTLQAVTVQAGTGERVTSIEVLDSSGGTQFTAYGGNRLPTAGGYSTQFNLQVSGMAIKIEKGSVLKVTTVTG